MEFFFVFLYIQSTHFCTATYILKSMEKVRECSFDWQNSLPACTLARRECTNLLTHQVSSEGQLPGSVSCRGG